MNIISAKIPVLYAPAIISAALEVRGTPAVQMFDSGSASQDEAFSPNRSTDPSYIVPVISVSTADASLSESNVSPHSAEWFVDDVAIVDSSWTSDDYEILTAPRDGCPAGTLILKKNFIPGESAKISAKMFYADPRTDGLLSEYASVIIRTTARSARPYALRSAAPRTFAYNRALDKLDERTYEASMTGVELTAAELSELRMTADSYMRDYPLHLLHGQSYLTSGYNVEVYDVSGDAPVMVNPDTDPVIVHVAPDLVTVDARTVSGSKDYEFRAIVNGKSVATMRISVRRIVPTLAMSLRSSGYISPAQKTRTDELAVTASGRTVRHPERIASMTWKAADAARPTQQRVIGHGSRIVSTPAALGLSQTTAAVNISVDAVAAPPLAVAVSDTGAPYTDASGNRYLI